MMRAMNRPPTYHNTTHVTGALARAYASIATGQEYEVMSFFEKHPRQAFSPDEIQSRVLSHAPLTSVRRAITNLTERGLLVKTGQQVMGRYGRPVYLWRLAEAEQGGVAND